MCPPLTSSQFVDWLERRQPEEFSFLDQAPAEADADTVISLADDDPDDADPRSTGTGMA